MPDSTTAVSSTGKTPWKRGLKIPPQGEGGYDQSWYPVCLASDVTVGTVVGRPFLNGEVVVFRGDSGVAQVLSAYCRHLGANLKVGQVIGDTVRCAFHHWSYDRGGHCVHIAAGDTPPDDARLFRFPTHEALGLIWAFNGEVADVPPPAFSIDEAELEIRSHHVKDMTVDPFMVFSNALDFQHLKSVHGIELIGDLEDFVLTDRTISYSQNMKVPGLGRMHQMVRVWGTNSIALEGSTMGRQTYQMSVGCPIPGGLTRIFNIDATCKAGDGPGEVQMVEQILQIMIDFGERLIAEDAPVHDTMRFRHDRMAASDKYLATYLRFARLHPRTNEAEDMIGN